MANVYNLEPQPTAKVILQTTSGDLTLELFAKQTPLASRNFLQHCLDGFYTNTIFHRLVPNFILQGGDPTNTGTGGVSAINNGDGFENELHSRLKFNRRGLLGMANEEGTNGSQYFLTLGATPELQGKNTMFGRVEGDTIYNLMKMADAELEEAEGSEKPLYPTRITGAEVLVNPFEDMVARVQKAPVARQSHGEKTEVRKRKKTGGKNVLSFGAEEGEEETSRPALKKVKANPKLVTAAVEEAQTNGTTATKTSKPAKSQVARRKSPLLELKPEQTQSADEPPARIAKAHENDPDSSPEPAIPNPTSRTSNLSQTNAEFAALKASMKRSNGIATSHQNERPPLTALEALIPSTSTRGRKRGKASDEKGALDVFKAFKQRLEQLPANPAPSNTNQRDASSPQVRADNNVNGATNDTEEERDEEAALCDLHFIAHCQSCASWDDRDTFDAEAETDEDGGGAGGGADWMAHRLSFAKDTLGKDLEWKKRMAELEMVDTRVKGGVGGAEERRREKVERREERGRKRGEAVR